MYWLKPGIKRDPQRRWDLPDRIFFGRGACHILAGTFLDAPPLPGFHAEWIVPAEPFAGSHVYVTDCTIAFDFHGYAVRDRLLAQPGAADRGAIRDGPGMCGRSTSICSTRQRSTPARC